MSDEPDEVTVLPPLRITPERFLNTPESARPIDVRYRGQHAKPVLTVTPQGDWVCLDVDAARSITRAMQVPDAALGIPTPWWRRFVQRFTRRARQRARRG